MPPDRAGGQFHDGVSTCDGSTGCTLCTFTSAGTCGADFYHDVSGCDGRGTDDNECVACQSTPADCLAGAGEFLRPACTGVETSDVSNCTACHACECGTTVGMMLYYDRALCGGSDSGCRRARGCNNNCNGHGTCDPTKGTCTCFDGWGSPTDVAFYKAPDCSQRTCPSAAAWFDLVGSVVCLVGGWVGRWCWCRRWCWG